MNTPLGLQQAHLELHAASNWMGLPEQSPIRVTRSGKIEGRYAGRLV